MTPAELAEIGTALFGQRWQTELADAIGVNARTVRRWAVGDTQMDSTMAESIVRVCRERAARLRELAKDLSSART